jgi:hypothetical protein
MINNLYIDLNVVLRFSSYLSSYQQTPPTPPQAKENGRLIGKHKRVRNPHWTTRQDYPPKRHHHSRWHQQTQRRAWRCLHVDQNAPLHGRPKVRLPGKCHPAGKIQDRHQQQRLDPCGTDQTRQLFGSHPRRGQCGGATGTVRRQAQGPPIQLCQLLRHGGGRQGTTPICSWH